MKLTGEVTDDNNLLPNYNGEVAVTIWQNGFKNDL
jgi:hypothetical protein